MAELENIFGKIRGRLGNVDFYKGKNGKNYCKSASFKRRSSKKPQKCSSVVFGTVTGMERWLLKIIRIGFPGGNGYPKGVNGFASANAVGVVEPETIHPDQPFNRRKKATQLFRGIINPAKLRIAAGTLVSPRAEAIIDPVNRQATFTHHGILINSVDCFMDDKIYGVILFPQKQYCQLVTLGTRGETTSINVDLPEKVDPDETALYIFATSASGKEASDSICLREPCGQPS